MVYLRCEFMTVTALTRRVGSIAHRHASCNPAARVMRRRARRSGLARSEARSAFLSSVTASIPSAEQTATQTLAVTCRSWSPMQCGMAIAARSWSALMAASSLQATSDSRTTNRRKYVSASRRLARALQ